jgi:hypothetical protein
MKAILKDNLVIIPLIALIMGCNRNSAKNGIQGINQQGKHIYITHKEKEKDTVYNELSDSTIVMGSSKIKVSISLIIKGDYVKPDTICSLHSDTCNVYISKDRFVHITIKSSNEKNIVINGDFVAKSVKEMNFSNCSLNSTTIDSIAISEKKIIFSTFLDGSTPQSYWGWSAIYSVNTDGEIKFIKVVRNDNPCTQ